MSLEPITLFNANNVAMAVTNGSAIPASTQGLIIAGKDENTVGRFPLVESKLNAEVIMDIKTYGARFSAFNVAPTTSTHYICRPQWDVGPPVVPNNFGGSTIDRTAFQTVSDSANDTANGTGCRSILVFYSGTDDNIYGTTITMNGVTPVTTALSPSVQYILGVIATYGSAGGDVGTVTVSWPGAVDITLDFWIQSSSLYPPDLIAGAGRTVYITSLNSMAVQASARLFNIYVGDKNITVNPGSVTNKTLDIDAFWLNTDSPQNALYDPPITIKDPSGSSPGNYLPIYCTPVDVGVTSRGTLNDFSIDS